MSFAAIASSTLAGLKIAGTAALGAVKAPPGLLTTGIKATPGLLAKGVGQLNPMAGTAGSTMGPQQASMMNKFVIGAKDLAGSGLSKINQLGIDPNSMGPNQSLLTRFTGGAKDLAGKGIGKLNELGVEELKKQLPKFGETLGTDKSKLGALTKDLIHKAPEAAMAQEKRNQELISRYSTTPTLSPARPSHSTKLQSILEDYRRS